MSYVCGYTLAYLVSFCPNSHLCPASLVARLPPWSCCAADRCPYSSAQFVPLLPFGSFSPSQSSRTIPSSVVLRSRPLLILKVLEMSYLCVPVDLFYKRFYFILDRVLLLAPTCKQTHTCVLATLNVYFYLRHQLAKKTPNNPCVLATLVQANRACQLR